MGLKLKSGEWVEIKSKEEILQTLDGAGRLDGLPFMPEMFDSCGKRFQVYKRAHKTCDTITGRYDGRRMKDAVHFEELRCSGESHGGCQAGCLLFWKAEWIKRSSDVNSQEPRRTGSATCSEADVRSNTSSGSGLAGDITYMCQMTELVKATTFWSAWDVRQYFEDLASRNVSLRRMVSGFIYLAVHHLANAGIGFGRPIRWLYDSTARLRRGYPYPRRTGPIRKGAKTPVSHEQFEPGELVRVKSYRDILPTLDQINRNRGLAFDAELVPFCGTVQRVKAKVTRIIDERNGKMLEFKTPSYILDGVVCQARYSECRMFCPRELYSFWREIWLDKADG